MTPATLMELARSLMARDMAEFDLDAQIQEAAKSSGIQPELLDVVTIMLRECGPTVFEAGYHAGLKAAFEISDEIKRGRSV